MTPVLPQLQRFAPAVSLAADPILAETETTPVAALGGLMLEVYAVLILKSTVALLVIGIEQEARTRLALTILPHQERRVRHSAGRVV